MVDRRLSGSGRIIWGSCGAVLGVLAAALFMRTKLDTSTAALAPQTSLLETGAGVLSEPSGAGRLPVPVEQSPRGGSPGPTPSEESISEFLNSAFLGASRAFQDAKHYLQDPEYNPDEKQLTLLEISELQSLIDGLNSEMRQLQRKESLATRDFADAKIARGDFTFLQLGETLQTSDPQASKHTQITPDGLIRATEVVPGESVVVDALLKDEEILLEYGFSEIRLFIMKH